VEDDNEGADLGDESIHHKTCMRKVVHIARHHLMSQLIPYVTAHAMLMK
jgi:hypothetical protein